MGTSHVVAEHPSLGGGNNAFTLPFLILHSVSSRYSSDFSSCNPLPSTTVREGFSHVGICRTQARSAICAIGLRHAAAPAAAAVPPRCLMQRKDRLSVNVGPGNRPPVCQHRSLQPGDFGNAQGSWRWQR